MCNFEEGLVHRVGVVPSLFESQAVICSISLALGFGGGVGNPFAIFRGFIRVNYGSCSVSLGSGIGSFLTTRFCRMFYGLYGSLGYIYGDLQCLSLVRGDFPVLPTPPFNTLTGFFWYGFVYGCRIHLKQFLESGTSYILCEHLLVAIGWTCKPRG